jgi:decaprenylphospho-beta-D-ribofuranose 2-oxidase
MMELCGWGSYPKIATERLVARNRAEVSSLVATRSGLIARGQGRAYGDAAIGMTSTLCSGGLDRMQWFDPDTGDLAVEAGVTIADILATFVPRGFFLKVVPGTKFVSVGGAIASDIHGKNHHRDGGFGDHVVSLALALPNGEILTCSRDQNEDLFWATIGGMGLTGVITEATLRLRPIETGWLTQQTLIADNLEAAIETIDQTASAPYSVAWIDCQARGTALGRSLIYVGDHASVAEKDRLGPALPRYPAPRAGLLSVPSLFPRFALNSLSVRAFNECYFRHGASQAGVQQLVSWDHYFFPLDTIANWNRVYGRRGFLQHQCVIPASSARSALAQILDRTSRFGNASFLAVLKLLGDSHGLMSFPMRGYTLAMDFPVNESVFGFLDEIDALVVAAGGRLYLAKDARQSRAAFEQGYIGLKRFRAVRKQIGADKHFSSHLSARLGI